VDGDQGVRVIPMHDGSTVRFRGVAEAYDPTDRDAAYAHVRRLQERGEVATGLLYIEEGLPDMHETAETVESPLVDLPYEGLCPGADALVELMAEFR
jgi:2-oxoglutarate ferredoxin oxidoreductase subunit beta